MPKQMFIYVITKKGDRTFWTKVGVATENQDGSFDCECDIKSFPEGKLHIRPAVVSSDKKEL